jgi:2-polyprenyl-6-methoxyphenol hydroxylase-like FAD-dependent oxidoreductase
LSAPKVAIVGGSLAGLSAALLLARRDVPVVVLEKDPTPVPGSAADAGSWRRSATPQAGHSHAFLAGARSLLAAEVPEVLEELRAAGVAETVLSPPRGSGDLDRRGDQVAELVAIDARRSTFEWALRRVAAAEPGVDLRAGVGVSGLRCDGPGAGRVAGVETSDGFVEASVVIAAAGKRSPVRTWFGDEEPVRDVACGISYLTRFYRLRGEAPVPLNRGFTHGASFDRYSCLVFPGDQGSFSVTFGVLPEDRELRILREPGAFDAAARALPLIAPWVDPSVALPTSDVALMASLRNLLHGRPSEAPAGLHAIGDARCVTNPAHTRGSTLALQTAAVLAGAVADHPDDPMAQAEVLDAHVGGDLAAWVEDSIGQDADRLARWRPGTESEQPLWRHRLTNGQAYLAGQRDPWAWLTFTRLQNALALPAEVLDDERLAQVHEEVRGSGWSPPAADAPSHDDLVALARRRLAAA